MLGGVSCVDPASIIDDLMAQNAPTVNRWWGKANSFATGPGAEPGRGHVVITRADAFRLTFTTDLTLAFSGSDPAHVVTLARVTVVKSECVSPGSSTDPTAVYLVEVADRRHLDGLIPLDKGYNIPKADGSAYMTATLIGGATPWTWQQVVTDIAAALGYGALTLPFTPSGTPENLFYYGVPSALMALCDVLTRCGCDLAYDPILDAFAVVRLGAAQDTTLAAVSAVAKRTWDGYSAEPYRAYYPQTVRVRFLRHPYDNTTGNSLFWVEDVALSNVTGVRAGTYVQIDDDLTAIGTSGTPTNAAALTARAAERAADWVRKRVYYDRPVLRAWVDFVPTAAGLGAYAVNKVVFDDRGGVMQTWAEQTPDGALEKWRPLSNLPPWYPLSEALTSAVPVPSSGSGTGTGSSGSGGPPSPSPDGPYNLSFPQQSIAVEGIRDTVCILGVRYTTRGRLVPFINASVIGLSWYLLETRPDGCCPCPATSGSGSGTDPTACCPFGTLASIPVAFSGHFGPNCEVVAFGGVLNRSGDGFEGAVTATGGYTGVAKFSCVGGAWRIEAVATRPDGTMVQIGFPMYLSAETNLYVGSEIYNRLDCGTGNMSVGATAGNPCLPEPGPGSGTGSGGSTTPACCSSPVNNRLYVTFSGALASLGKIALDYNGTLWTTGSPGPAHVPCGQPAAPVTLACLGGTVWNIVYGAVFGVSPQTSGLCSPMSLVFTGTMIGTCFPSTATATISNT